MQQFIGNITKDAVTRKVGKTTVTQVTIAENRKVKRGDSWVNEAVFVQCSIWDKEGLAQHLVTGTLIAVTGSVRADVYNDRPFLKIDRVADIVLLGGKPTGQKSNGGSSDNRNGSRNDAAQTGRGNSGQDHQDHDDIPF